MNGKERLYYGIGDVPKGYRRATMAEAVSAGQVRYYGIKKIDSRTIEAGTAEKKRKISRMALLKKFAGLNGSIRRQEGQVEIEKGKEQKRQAQKVLDGYKKERNIVVKQLRALEDDGKK